MDWLLSVGLVTVVRLVVFFVPWALLPITELLPIGYLLLPIVCHFELLLELVLLLALVSKGRFVVVDLT